MSLQNKQLVLKAFVLVREKPKLKKEEIWKSKVLRQFLGYSLRLWLFIFSLFGIYLCPLKNLCKNWLYTPWCQLKPKPKVSRSHIVFMTCKVSCLSEDNCASRRLQVDIRCCDYFSYFWHHSSKSRYSWKIIRSRKERFSSRWPFFKCKARK